MTDYFVSYGDKSLSKIQDKLSLWLVSQIYEVRKLYKSHRLFQLSCIWSGSVDTLHETGSVGHNISISKLNFGYFSQYQALYYPVITANCDVALEIVAAVNKTVAILTSL